MSERPDVTKGHETSDIGLGAFALGAGVLVVLLFLAVVSMWGLLGRLNERAVERGESRNPLIEDVRRLPPEPRLQANPIEDLDALRALEERELSSFGWVDRSTGRVRIPIDHAIDRLLVQNGGAR